MESSRLFLKKFKIMRFQVWNLAKFQTWNHIILNFFKKSLEYSKINEIYFLWTLSGPILSKIWDNFFSKKKVSVVGGIWKRNPKISQFSNLKSDFFLILRKNRKSTKIPKIYSLWTSFEPILSQIRETFLRSVAHYICISLRVLFVT